MTQARAAHGRRSCAIATRRAGSARRGLFVQPGPQARTMARAPARRNPGVDSTARSRTIRGRWSATGRRSRNRGRARSPPPAAPSPARAPAAARRPTSPAGTTPHPWVRPARTRPLAVGLGHPSSPAACAWRRTSAGKVSPSTAQRMGVPAKRAAAERSMAARLGISARRAGRTVMGHRVCRKARPPAGADGAADRRQPRIPIIGFRPRRPHRPAFTRARTLPPTGASPSRVAARPPCCSS